MSGNSAEKDIICRHVTPSAKRVPTTTTKMKLRYLGPQRRETTMYKPRNGTAVSRLSVARTIVTHVVFGPDGACHWYEVVGASPDITLRTARVKSPGTTASCMKYRT